MKHKILSLLLLGLLSMLYAEIFSGASQLWFINPFGILYTYPLYMLHTVFFLSIALRYQKTSIRHLYFFGILFGLYEAIITKVLWQGYMNETGPGLGKILGIAAIEFPILTFFWHPIFSFILPILTYQLLSGHILNDHVNMLTPSKQKNIIGFIVLIAISTFIVNGNQQNLISALLAFGGTVLLIVIVMRLIGDKPLSIERFKEMNLIGIFVLLIAIYLFGGFCLMADRFPNQLIPYITIGAFYVFMIWMLFRSSPSNTFISEVTNQYQVRTLIIMMIMLFVMIVGMSFIWTIGNIVMVIAYFVYTIIGIIIFATCVFQEFKRKDYKHIENEN